MSDSLDSIVKGSPPSSGVFAENMVKNASAGLSPIAASTTSSATGTGAAGSSKAGDPLSHTPSSPSMIYLNLLILEASLRAQYLDLRARRRHHTFFLSLLTLWIAGFGYALFLAPREDGRGVGGSVYWVVESTERVCFLGGILTAVLVWAVGIWDRGVRWPRRWFVVSNRGLRGFNCKLVIIKRPWWRETLSTTGWFLTYGLFANNGGPNYRYVEPSVLREVDRAMNIQAQGTQQHTVLPVLTHVGDVDEENAGHEEDLASGGDHVKLLLLAKPFSSTFRENWEVYREEYWDRENERRALLRKKIKERDRRLSKEHGGWFWRLPWRPVVVPAPEKHHEKVHNYNLNPRHAAVAGEHRRLPSNSGSLRRGSMSANTSLSSTPTHEVEDQQGVAVSRRASTTSNVADAGKRRKKAAGNSGSQRGRQGRPRAESRSITHENPSPLARETSVSHISAPR